MLGHFVRNNDHWRKPVIGDALVIVRGPDSYITPSWYASKAEHGRVVPTWNYMTAHVYGSMTVHDDPDWLGPALEALAAGGNKTGLWPKHGDIASAARTPMSVRADATLTAAAAGDAHSLVVTDTGDMFAWGWNAYGQLGDGTTSGSDVPVAVSLPTGTTVTAIAAGDGHSLGLTSSGQVLAWGWNDFGQLGNGTTTASNVPIPVSLPTGTTVTAIAAGDAHSLAVTSTGQVLTWGLNYWGELGNGTNDDSTTPVAVSLPPDTTITSIAAGTAHVLGLTSTNELLAWGGKLEWSVGQRVHHRPRSTGHRAGLTPTTAEYPLQAMLIAPVSCSRLPGPRRDTRRVCPLAMTGVG